MNPHDKIAHTKIVDYLLTRKGGEGGGGGRGKQVESSVGPLDTYSGSKQSRENLAFSFL